MAFRSGVVGGAAGVGAAVVGLWWGFARGWSLGFAGPLPLLCEGDGRHPQEKAKEVACGDGAREDHCHCRHVDFLIGSYPRVSKDTIIQRIDKWDDTTDGFLEDQELETMLVQQQGMVDKMIKYLENVEDRMRELERRAGIPAPGPNLPRDPAPESWVRRLTTLRTAAEGVAPTERPMELAPYGPPRDDPSLLRHIPRFSASVMLGEKTPKTGSGIGTPRHDTRERTVEINMSSPPAAREFDARAAYERRVAVMDS